MSGEAKREFWKMGGTTAPRNCDGSSPTWAQRVSKPGGAESTDFTGFTDGIPGKAGLPGSSVRLAERSRPRRVRNYLCNLCNLWILLLLRGEFLDSGGGEGVCSAGAGVVEGDYHPVVGVAGLETGPLVGGAGRAAARDEAAARAVEVGGPERGDGVRLVRLAGIHEQGREAVPDVELVAGSAAHGGPV